MQIRQLKIQNFRGIAALEWSVDGRLGCLIGAGDSGKSTILDAVEATLSSRWFFFTEPDFLNCESRNAIVIEVTVGELSNALKSDERFGLYVRGWTSTGQLNDEPEHGDEPVLTVRLFVDATMEPVWQLVCDRIGEPRTLSNRDRALFGLVRLAGDDARHLAWGQGSVLAKLTGDTNEASVRLAEAYRAARTSAKLDEIAELSAAAEVAEKCSKGLGAYIEGSYEPGLELGRAGLSSGSIALHDNGVPLRLAGLGSRRLATLAIQKSAIAEGAIVLVDEIEHGLEPHRIIGAIAQLKGDQDKAASDKKPIGQVFLTTHSEVAVAEAGAESLWVVQITRPSRLTTVTRPPSPKPIQELMRYTPRALFARRVLVTEGNTEVGMLLGIREFWPSRHGGKPIEQLGAAIADGNGAQACSIALALKALGYEVAIYRDSDTALAASDCAALAAAAIPVLEYGSGLNSEQAIFSAASDERVQELLEIARVEFGIEAVDNNIDASIPGLGLDLIRTPFTNWDFLGPIDGPSLRLAVAEVAANKKWFKSERKGRQVAPVVWQIAIESRESPLALALARAESWLYA